mgnify:CR=1 FL=1
MNEIKKPWLTGTSLLLAALLITACGGGGGPNSSRIDVPDGENPRTPDICEDPDQIFGIDSNGMILMAEDKDGKLKLLQPHEVTSPGSVIS